jgi:glutamyl endopeptidase
VLPIVKKRVLNRGTLRRVSGALGAVRGLAGSLLSESAEETDAEVEAELEAAAEQMEVIIGTDDRTRIRNTTAVPWRRICQLTIRARNGAQYVGTGFLIGKRTVITAGHCVFIHAAGGWPAYIDVAPGRNGPSRPFGTVRAIQFRSVNGWVSSKSRDHDYGAIILPANTPANIQGLGGFGFGYWPDSQLRQRMVNLSGYPGDGGKMGPDREPASQWWMARQITSVASRSFAYDIDTVGGQSGSPVWTLQNGQRIAVGIHTNGFVGGNSATRITAPVFNNLKMWRQQGS